jgi:hypothetical protein
MVPASELEAAKVRIAELEDCFNKSQAQVDESLDLIEQQRMSKQSLEAELATLRQPPRGPITDREFAGMLAAIDKARAAGKSVLTIRTQDATALFNMLATLRQREESAAAQSRQEAEWLQGAAYDYESEAPEVSYGHEDRFHTVRDGIVTPAFQNMGHSREEAAHLANSLYRLIAQGEARQGRNPVAAIDSFNTTLVMTITERLGMPMIPVSADGWNGGEQTAYQPQQVNPQQAEIQRQDAVRRRAAPAGNAGPRMAARTSTPRSEVAQLFAAGVHLQPGGYTKIQQAALRETGGDGQRAAVLMQQYG